MNKIIIERASICLFVKTASESNGHDCWGSYEYNTYNYVLISGQKVKLYGKLEDLYILHNGSEVLKNGYIDHLSDDYRQYLDNNMAAKKKEERYKHYLQMKESIKKYQNEFDNDPVYNRDQKLNDIIG